MSSKRGKIRRKTKGTYMSKQLRVAKVDSKFSLTVRELKGWLNSFTDESLPVILKCQRNFRLSKMTTVKNKPVLVGKRGASD